jgi:hypothetical protein
MVRISESLSKLTSQKMLLAHSQGVFLWPQVVSSPPRIFHQKFLGGPIPGGLKKEIMKNLADKALTIGGVGDP